MIRKLRTRTASLDVSAASLTGLATFFTPGGLHLGGTACIFAQRSCDGPSTSPFGTPAPASAAGNLPQIPNARSERIQH